MKLASKKPKPPVGMELTMTISMRPGHTVGQDAAAIVKFFKSAAALSRRTKAIWVRVRLTGVPEELEPKLRSALDAAQAEMDASGPKLVVDNTRPEPNP